MTNATLRILPGILLALTSAAALSAQISTTVANDPINARLRVRWLMDKNLSGAAVAEDVALGALYTWTNSPKEYGPHWPGFGKRTGMVAANYGVKTVMEAGLGSMWGEDPRYERTTGLTFGGRAKHVFAMTFLAKNRAGDIVPAYARYLAIPGSSFLSNTWRPDSEATVSDALVRTGLGFLSRLGENAWKEFVSKKH